MPIGTPSVPYVCRQPVYERIEVDIYTGWVLERILFFRPGSQRRIAQQPGWPQMLYSGFDDSSKPIYLLHQFSVVVRFTAGLDLRPPIQYVKSEVVTICVGLAARHGAPFSPGRPAPGKRGGPCPTPDH